VSTPQIVEFFTTKADAVKSYLPNTYQLRKDRDWLWVQKLAIWVLRKLGCFAIQEDAIITRHRFDGNTLLEAIMAQHSEVMNIYHRHGERLLIGFEEFRDLLGTEMREPRSFAMQYRWHEKNGYTVCGLKVTVIPWMKGILVVPRED
jgi:hypothetical protein